MRGKIRTLLVLLKTNQNPDSLLILLLYINRLGYNFFDNISLLRTSFFSFSLKAFNFLTKKPMHQEIRVTVDKCHQKKIRKLFLKLNCCVVDSQHFLLPLYFSIEKKDRSISIQMSFTGQYDN